MEVDLYCILELLEPLKRFDKWWNQGKLDVSFLISSTALFDAVRIQKIPKFMELTRIGIDFPKKTNSESSRSD
jgi:hypothetical protein